MFFRLDIKDSQETIYDDDVYVCVLQRVKFNILNLKQILRIYTLPHSTTLLEHVHITNNPVCTNVRLVQPNLI